MQKDPLSTWRRKISVADQTKSKRSRAPSPNNHFLQLLLRQTQGLSKKQVLLLAILTLIAAGVSLYIINELLQKHGDNNDPLSPSRMLLRNGGANKREHSCTMFQAAEYYAKKQSTKTKQIPAKQSLITQNLNELGLRQILSRKIQTESSEVPQGYSHNLEMLKNDIIDYYLSQCDQQLLYLVNTPVRMQLTLSIDSKFETYGRYEGSSNIIKIKVPITKNIVSSKSSMFPNDIIVRFLRHEGWHSIVAARNAINCDPATVFQAFLQGRAVHFPVNVKNPEAIEEAIKIGDQRLFDLLGKLVEKKSRIGFNSLSKPEQAEYNRYQHRYANYIPRRDIAVFDKSSFQELKNKGVLQQIAKGIPHKVTRPDSNIAIFIDEIHYQHDPIHGEMIFGSGYHLANPKDKLAAILIDTKWRNERVVKMYEKTLSDLSDPYGKRITELDAFLKEMGPEIADFYEEWRLIHENQEQQSVCQM